MGPAAGDMKPILFPVISSDWISVLSPLCARGGFNRPFSTKAAIPTTSRSSVSHVNRFAASCSPGSVEQLRRWLAEFPHRPWIRLTFVRGPRRLRHGAVAPERALGVRNRFLQFHDGGGSETEKARTEVVLWLNARSSSVGILPNESVSPGDEAPATRDVEHLYSSFQVPRRVDGEKGMWGACALRAGMWGLGWHPLVPWRLKRHLHGVKFCSINNFYN